MEETKKCSVCGIENSTKYCEECFKQKEYLRAKKRIIVKMAGSNKLKRILCAHLGGKCSNCEYNKCYRSLSFHHTDDSTKSFTLDVSNLMKKNMDDIVNEIDKCILLCANCHAIHHQNIRYCNYIIEPKYIPPKLRFFYENNSCCQNCFLSFHMRNYQCATFHHRDKNKKSFPLTCDNFEKFDKIEIQNEISKCDLLCFNCHMELEDKLSKNIS